MRYNGGMAMEHWVLERNIPTIDGHNVNRSKYVPIHFP